MEGNVRWVIKDRRKTEKLKAGKFGHKMEPKYKGPWKRDLGVGSGGEAAMMKRGVGEE